MDNSQPDWPWPRNAPVIVAGAPTYDERVLDDALAAIAEAAGGWDAIAPPPWTVLIKPNMMSAREPERAVTTHPALVAALARVFQKRGRTSAVADSPAGVFKGLTRVWENTGMRAACEAAGVPLVSLEGSGSITRRSRADF